MKVASRARVDEPGTLIISLDLELFWGVRDRATLQGYGMNVLGARSAVSAMLGLFERSQIAATWAAVGFLFFRTKAELLAHLPASRPAYSTIGLDPYSSLDALGEDEAADPYHFGRSLLERIRAVPFQEIGSHTFSHYYALESGQTERTFRHDLAAAVEAANRLGITLRSLVFPRNQCNDGYLETCRELGFTSYRGNERSWIYRRRRHEAESSWKRAGRLADSYVDLTGPHTFRLDDAARSGPPFNLPASRFLRPWSSRSRLLEELRMNRITRALTHAARYGEAYHLWWHPHNFGLHLRENMSSLDRILDHFDRLRQEYGMRSASMGDVAQSLLRESPRAREAQS